MKKQDLSLVMYIALAAVVITAFFKWRDANPEQVIAVAELLLYSVCPLAGVALAELWFMNWKKWDQFQCREIFRWPGLVAWVVGTGIAFALHIELAGALFSGLIYLVIKLFMKTAKKLDKESNEMICHH